jgi:hypothetical protein
MVRIELSDEEAGLLREVLEAKAHALLVEIRHTKNREFRDMLKARSASLDHVLALLGPEAASHPV